MKILDKIESVLFIRLVLTTFWLFLVALWWFKNAAAFIPVIPVGISLLFAWCVDWENGANSERPLFTWISVFVSVTSLYMCILGLIYEPNYTDIRTGAVNFDKCVIETGKFVDCIKETVVIAGRSSDKEVAQSYASSVIQEANLSDDYAACKTRFKGDTCARQLSYIGADAGDIVPREDVTALCNDKPSPTQCLIDLKASNYPFAGEDNLPKQSWALEKR